MTLADLITRVEQGSGSDRQLDTQIIQALYPDIGNCHPHCPGEEPIFWHDPFRKMPAPHLTSSLDAIRALLKARLNGHMFDILETPSGYLQRVNIMPNDVECPPVYSSSKPDIHRAFLSATLKAIAAKEG